MKKFVNGIVITCFVLLGVVSQAKADDETLKKEFHRLKTLEVKVTNLTRNIVLTPPIFATNRRPIRFYSLAQPADLALEMLAEAGSTEDLAGFFEDQGAQDVVTDTGLILPGETLTIHINGSSNSFLHMASMLLPTNDGFIALNGIRVWRLKKKAFYLNAYDAGTELNDEFCGKEGNIPGPVEECGGGQGYNPEGGEGRVTPHPGIHGMNDVSAMMFNWGEPVAKITVRAQY